MLSSNPIGDFGPNLVAGRMNSPQVFVSIDNFQGLRPTSAMDNYLRVLLNPQLNIGRGSIFAFELDQRSSLVLTKVQFKGKFVESLDI